MSEERRGWRWIGERRYMQVRTGGKKRESIALPGPKTDEEANDRAALIQDIARDLVAAGRVDRVKAIGERVGLATTQREIEDCKKAVTKVIELGAVATKETTFEEFAKQWTSGDLHRRYPDHVKKRNHRANISTLKTHILPYVRSVPMSRFELTDGETVMGHIPAERSTATRRHVAQILYKLCRMAVYPAKLLKVNPLPAGFLPKLGPDKGKPYLYPDEEAKLLGFKEIPLERRLVYGILAREGFRASELIGNATEGIEALVWSEIDLARGAVILDETKTGRIGSWALDPGVARALKRWWERSGRPGPDQPIFPDPPGRLAEHLRADLNAAGVTRAELHTRTGRRMWMKAHHLRATFVTLSLAAGKTETWVQDRTGHTSTLMINRYRQSARTAAELGVGELRPLDRAIPEFRRDGETKVKKDRTSTSKKGR